MSTSISNTGKVSGGEKVEIVGLKRTVRQLKKLESTIPNEVKALNKAAAVLVAATARERAPVGGGRDPHPGRLRDSIRPGATQYMSSVRAGGTTVPYAAPIHWGWGVRHIQPQPFMYEALDARRSEVVETYRKGVAKLVNVTVSGAGDD